MSELIPEYYSDVFYLRSGPWGVATSYSVAAPKEGIGAHDVCVVRLSHETAVISTKALKHRKSARPANMLRHTTNCWRRIINNKL